MDSSAAFDQDFAPGAKALLPDDMSVAGLLATEALSGSEILAGKSGAGREVSRFNVMEVPDIERWVRPNELLLTAGYAIRKNPKRLTSLIAALHEKDAAAIGIKLGRYIEEVPQESLDMADTLGFPIIAIPADVSFDDVLTKGSIDLANRHVRVMNYAEKLQRRLVDIVLAGGELQAVSNAIAHAMNTGVMMTTPDGRQITIAGTEEQIAAIRDSSALDGTGRLRTDALEGALGVHPLPVVRPAAHGTSRSTTEVKRQTRRDAGTVSAARDSSGAMSASAESGSAESAGATSAGAESAGAASACVDSVAVAPVLAGHVDHGRVAAFAFDRTLGQEDLYALDRASSVCALVITRDRAVAAVEEKYRADYVRDLLLGRAGPGPQAVTHARSFGWDLDRELTVVVIEPDPVDQVDEQTTVRRPLVERQAQAFAGALRHRDEGAAVAALTTETVIIMGAAHREQTTQKVVDLVGVVRGDGGGGRRPFSVGISRSCESTESIPMAYSQARTALRVGRQISGGAAVTHFDELGVYRLLSLVEDEAELESFARETLRELAEDTPEATDLRRTLELLLATNINVAETARTLHFHYNTLRYRISKLERMLGPFTSQPTLRLDLSLALKILSMRGINR
ncbi:PucR family transcriptional regulator ligand-binding domain-containing protein [Saxibacter everestensis]|uniref:PucR family transcriptional regulator ligand-binding domain-containing protein n=1 Tax=Saxibacter everestensis TaxID=2909229 RepID=A0ABY8QTP6_9MICO|nr:PucR family transcriptional regulator ligand-binding domain-containing protein [Brevibacteriaceae bacterium ZFBP1038]